MILEASKLRSRLAITPGSGVDFPFGIIKEFSGGWF